MEKYKNLPVQVKASIWFVISSFLQKGISILTTPIFTRLLTTEEYGSYTVFNSWLSILTPIISLNLCAGVFSQGLIKFSHDSKKFSSSLQCLSLTIVLFWTVIYILFRPFWNNLLSLNTNQVLALLILIWTSAVFGFWACEQRVQYKYKILIIITVLISLLKPTLSIMLIRTIPNKVDGRIFGILIAEILCYLWMFFYDVIKGKLYFDKFYWTYALKFNIPLVPHYLSQTILNDSDRIMIEKQCGLKYAGMYGLAYSLASMMILFNTSFMNVLSPWIYQKLKDKDYNNIGPISYLCLVVIAFFNLILIGFAPEIIKIFAPIEYLESIWAIPPIAMSTFFIFLYDLFAKIEFYYEKTKYIMFASIVGAILNVCLNLIFLKIFGFVAAAYTTLLCMIIYSFAHYFFMRLICKRYLNNVIIYNVKYIMLIIIIFCSLGFILMIGYMYWFVRIAVFCLLLIIFGFNYKKIIYRLSNFKSFLLEGKKNGM